MKIEIDVIIIPTQKTDKYYLDIDDNNGIYSEMGEIILYDESLLEKFIQKELYLKTKINFRKTIEFSSQKTYIDGGLVTTIITNDEYKLYHRNKILKTLI